MKILIIDDEPVFRDYLALILTDVFKHDVTITNGYNQAMQIPLKQMESFDIAFIDMQMPVIDGFQAGTRLKQQFSGLVTIMLTAYPSIEKAIVALRDYAFDDFLMKEELEDVEEYTQLQNALRRGKNLSAARKALSEEYQLSDALRSRFTDVYSEIIGQSAEIVEVRQMIEKVAPNDTTILIGGETGSGKELVAREIHRKSRRRLKPFVPINCSSIPSGLLESELFGHKKGSFTGAIDNREGYFQLAEGGTLFLDEIGDMPSELQSKLLRVLEDRQFFPVGASRLSDAVKVDVRIISASHQNLQKKTELGEFRQDLLYRLNTMVLTLPPLKERIDDISVLASFFIAQHPNSERTKGIRSETMEILQLWPWPGNVRELQNIIERAMLLNDGDYLEPSSLPVELQENASNLLQSDPGQPVTAGGLQPPIHGAGLPRGRHQDPDLGEQLWSAFEQNDFWLWRFLYPEKIAEQLQTGLQGARYVKKGHSARLFVARDFQLDVPVQYLNAISSELDTLIVRFIFMADPLRKDCPVADNGLSSNGIPVVLQPVIKGQPDTYLFNILYPPPKRRDLGILSAPRIVRALLLRFALTHARTGSLKSVFERTMSFLMDESRVSQIDGLTSDGLEAMRAYLCGADHIFAGMARRLKSQPEAIALGIQEIFPAFRLP